MVFFLGGPGASLRGAIIAQPAWSTKAVAARDRIPGLKHAVGGSWSARASSSCSTKGWRAGGWRRVSACGVTAGGVTAHALVPVFAGAATGKVVFGILHSGLGVLAGGYRLFEKLMSA